MVRCLQLEIGKGEEKGARFSRVRKHSMRGHRAAPPGRYYPLGQPNKPLPDCVGDIGPLSSSANLSLFVAKCAADQTRQAFRWTPAGPSTRAQERVSSVDRLTRQRELNQTLTAFSLDGISHLKNVPVAKYRRLGGCPSCILPGSCYFWLAPVLQRPAAFRQQKYSRHEILTGSNSFVL